MVPSRVAELVACLNGADRPALPDPQRYAGLAGSLPESLSIPVGNDLDEVIELLHGVGKTEAGLIPGPFPVPRQALLQEILSDRGGAGVTWSDAILAWRRWEGLWHGVHTDPAGSGVTDVAEDLLWLGPGGSDAHQRLYETQLSEIRDGDLVVGHLVDRRRGGAWFAGGRLGPRRFASVLAAAYGRTDRLRHRRVIAVGIPPDIPAEHAELFELMTGRLRQLLDRSGTDRRERSIICTVATGGEAGQSQPADHAAPVTAVVPTRIWVELVLPTGERFDLELDDGPEPPIPAGYPVERGPLGRQALICLDDVQRLYDLARRALPGAEPEPAPEPTPAPEPAPAPAPAVEPEPVPEPEINGREPVGPDHDDLSHPSIYFGEISSLRARIAGRLMLLPSQLRPEFETLLANAQTGLEQLPRPDPPDRWHQLNREQVTLLRQARDAMSTLTESIMHAVLRPDISEHLFREAAQLLDAAIRQRAEDVRARVALLDQPERDTAAADLDSIRGTLTQSLHGLRGEATVARGDGDLSQQDMYHLERQAYRFTLKAYEQIGALLETIGADVTPVG